MKSLVELAERYGTDKRRTGHNYVEMYESILKIIKVNSLLEIGLGDGASMRMWIDYFPDADIYCIENFGDENKIKWKNFKGDIEGLDIISGDSSVKETWDKVRYGLDVIIDDGSHEPQTQYETFLLGFEHLGNGGLYFIEDTHSSFQPHFYIDRHCFLYDWAFDNVLNQQETLDLSGHGGNFYTSRMNMNPLASQIFSYHFYKSVIVFEKAK